MKKAPCLTAYQATDKELTTTHNGEGTSIISCSLLFFKEENHETTDILQSRRRVS